MSYECKLIERKAQPVMFIRGHSAAKDLPNFFEQSFGALARYISQAGGQMSGAPYAAYHNMDMKDLDVEAGIPVNQPLPDKDDIQSGEIPAGKYASATHTGPYSDVEPIYNAIMQWMKDKGYETTGVSYEFYLNDPDETPPEKLETLILFPVNI